MCAGIGVGTPLKLCKGSGGVGGIMGVAIPCGLARACEVLKG